MHTGMHDGLGRGVRGQERTSRGGLRNQILWTMKWNVWDTPPPQLAKHYDMF